MYIFFQIYIKPFFIKKFMFNPSTSGTKGKTLSFVLIVTL